MDRAGAAAEELAIAALGWMAGDDELLQAFILRTGLGPQALREAAGSAEFLGGVLDFILEDDARVLALAGALGCAPEEIAAARARLPGGDLPHWT